MSSIDTQTNSTTQVNKQMSKKVSQDENSSKKEIIEFDWKNKWLKGN
jgi:hypothetical protein